MKPSELDLIAQAIDEILKLKVSASPRFGMMLKRMRAKIAGDVDAFREAKGAIVNRCAMRAPAGSIVFVSPGSIRIDPEKGAEYLTGMADLDKDDRPLADCGLEIVPFDLWPESLPIDAVDALFPIIGDPPQVAAK